MRDSKDVDELRGFIHSSPNDIHVADAVQRIAILEYQRAVAADTRYAYRMFLQRHPDSLQAFEVKRRLEHLDFVQAKQQKTLEALLDFLRAWPGGSYDSQARELADGLYCQRFLNNRDADLLTAFIAAHPDISCRGDLLMLEEKLLFEEAVKSGSATKLIEFIHSHPSASVTKEARSELARRRVEALVRAARFDRAREVVKKHAYADQQAGMLVWIDKALLDWVRSSLDPPLIWRSVKSFDAESKQDLWRWAAKISARRRAYRNLAEATALLRSPLVAEPVGDTTAVDPRQRWLDAERLALSPEEDTAEFLLDLLGDSFLQVRKQARESLKQVVASLGKVRGDIWLAEKKSQLAPKAETGILLLKLAILLDLSGQTEEALSRLEAELESAENPDPFVLYCAAGLARELGQNNKAATLTRRLSQALVRFYRQRVQAWEGLHDSDRGWLTLRQIYGAQSLWRAALDPFLPDAAGQTRLSPAEELLGKWVERSRTDLKTLEAWFIEEERKWKLNNADFVACDTADEGAIAMRESESREWDAVFLLVFSGLPETRRTIQWTAGCHPRKTTRLLAVILPHLANLTVSIGLGKNL